uniref:Uncharacterized protein n=1 Tax=viral metagenome TaxID=1070528 RepID=A0A6M3MEW3_9ZZZZ
MTTNTFVTFPTTDKETLAVGTARIDFLNGKVTLASGTIKPLVNRSTVYKPLRSVYFNTDQDINVKIYWDDELQYSGLIPAGTFYLKNIVVDQMEITTTASTVFMLIASTSPNGVDIGVYTDAANTARTTATPVQPIQHIGANGSPMPSGATVGDPIHVSTGGAIATTVGSNRQIVGTPTTPVALAASTAIKKVTVTAETNNTDIVCVGGANVLATLLTRRGTPLYPSDSITLEADNLAEVFIDALVATEGVTFTYLA